MTDQPPSELPGITVTGTRLVFTVGPGGGSPGDPSHNPEEQNEVGEGNDGPSGPTQEEVDAENERQKECAAKQYKTQLDTEKRFSKDKKEFFTFTWTRNGQTTTHPIREGSGARIQTADLNAALSEFSINASNITGFNHNHPADEYCNGSGDLLRSQEIENGYPSVNDWVFADALVGAGANPDELTLFIADCDGVLRGFPYSQKIEFQEMFDRKQPPPPPINPENCP